MKHNQKIKNKNQPNEKYRIEMDKTLKNEI